VAALGQGKASGSVLNEGGARPAGTKKRLRVWAEPIRKGRSQNDQRFFASFVQKRRPSFRLAFGATG
jgi:hypothetical protein